MSRPEQQLLDAVFEAFACVQIPDLRDSAACPYCGTHDPETVRLLAGQAAAVLGVLGGTYDSRHPESATRAADRLNEITAEVEATDIHTFTH